MFTCGWMDGQTNVQADRQTDMTKLIVAFRNFTNAPQNLMYNARKLTVKTEKKGIRQNKFPNRDIFDNFNFVSQDHCQLPCAELNSAS